MRLRSGKLGLVALATAALLATLFSHGVVVGQPTSAALDLRVEMTATVEGATATYTITLRNPTAADVGDIFIAGLIPADGTFKAATTTPSESWFRGVENAGSVGNVAVWLSRRVPAGSTQGPFAYQVTLAAGSKGAAHAWVHWRGPSEGTSISVTATPGSPSAQPSLVSYAGSRACKTCHEKTYNAWQNSLHAHMIRPAAKGDLSSARADLKVTGAPKADQYDWAFVIGGWYKEERYAYRDTSGVFKVGEFEYNVPKKEFTLRKDKAGNPESLDWINECGGCHATGMQPAARQWSEMNIGCEACHGPGADHVKNPSTVRMYVDNSSESCGKCHIRGRDKSGQFNYPVDYEFGKPATLMAKFNPIPMTDAASIFPDQKNSNRHRQQYLDWSKSDHASWNVGCTTCHDPHKGALTQRKADLRASGDDLCAKCHADKAANPVAHSRHSAQMASCASCHLPKLIGSGSVSTHTFEAIAPAKTIQYGDKMANSCTYKCHKTQGVQWADQAYQRIFKK